MSILNFLLEAPETSASTAMGSYTIGKFAGNMAGYIKTIGGYIFVIIGVLIIFIGIMQIAGNLMSPRKANGWLMPCGALLVGGCITFSGFSGFITNGLSKMGQLTAEKVVEKTNIAGFDAGALTGTVMRGASNTTAMSGALNYMVSEFQLVCFAVAAGIGVVLIVFATASVMSMFVSHGKTRRSSWVKLGAMCILGSVLFFSAPTDNGTSGFDWIRTRIGGTLKTSVETIAPDKAYGYNGGEDDALINHIGSDNFTYPNPAVTTTTTTEPETPPEEMPVYPGG